MLLNHILENRETLAQTISMHDQAQISISMQDTSILLTREIGKPVTAESDSPESVGAIQRSASSFHY